MGATLAALEIGEQRSEIERLVRQTTAKAGLVARARMILLAADGASNAAIARELRCQPHVVGKWRRRFAALGSAGLEDQPRSGRPREMSPRVQQRVVTTACRQPPLGLSRWSVRTLARHLGLPPAGVGRVLQALDLHLHCYTEQIRNLTVKAIGSPTQLRRALSN